MKLKLENKDTVSVLSVTEGITPEHAGVLRTGLSKLCSEKNALVVDLTSLPSVDAALWREITGNLIGNPELPCQLLVASPQPGIGNAATLDETVALVGSEYVKLLAMEAWLTGQVHTFEDQKQKFETALASDSGFGQTQKLRKENSDRKVLIRSLEREIDSLLKSRKDPAATAATAAKRDALNQLLASTLQKEGILR